MVVKQDPRIGQHAKGEEGRKEGLNVTIEHARKKRKNLNPRSLRGWKYTGIGSEGLLLDGLPFGIFHKGSD